MTLDDLYSDKPDYAPFLVYSDYCEDADDLLTANAMRWFVKYKRWPFWGFAGFQMTVCSSFNWGTRRFERYSSLVRNRCHVLPHHFKVSRHLLFPDDVNYTETDGGQCIYRPTWEKILEYYVEAFRTGLAKCGSALIWQL